MAIITRHVNSPPEYDLDIPGRGTLQSKIYVGFVKYVDDVNFMGRLQVWIPELSGNPNDQNGWFIVSYCSPFAGATDIQDSKNDNSFSSTQKSYGMWFVPPDINNEVVCAFINGDPARGIWFGCLYQQNMNSMVPGLPGQNSQDGLPTAEYNKKTQQNLSQSPARPLYEPLADQLVKQGLNQDTTRGISDSGARRADPNNSVYGILTPGGNHMVFDDNPANTYIRFRTPSGVQLLLNDTTGCVYLNSVDGKNWVSMDAGGRIDIYAASDISIRSQGSLNLRADQDVNIEAGQNINMRARGTTAVTPVVNSVNTTTSATVTPGPGPTVSIGDGIASAIGTRITDAIVIATPNNTSSQTLEAITSNAGAKGTVNSVISVGTSDFTNNTGNTQLLTSNITSIRQYLGSSNFIWVLPYNDTAKSTIKSFASSNNDQTVDLSNYPTNNNVYPRDFNVVTNDITALLKPANPNGTTPEQTGSTGNSNVSTSSTADSSPVTNSEASTSNTTNTGNVNTSGQTYIDIVVPFLKQVEGKSNAAYWDAANQRVKVSIGYGHQIKSNEYSQGYIDTITAGRIAVVAANPNSNPPGCGNSTDAQCTALLSIDVVAYAAGARNTLQGAWDLLGPYQQAALTSVYYNSPLTLKKLVGQGITNYITKSDLQSAAQMIATIGPASVASRRVKESNLYLQRPDLLGQGGSTPVPGQADGGINSTIPGTGGSQSAPGTLVTENPNIQNGYIRIESTNSMHLLSQQCLFLTSGNDMHRYSAGNMFDTASTNWNRAAGGFVHESVGADFSVGASSEINLFGTRIDLNSTPPPLAVGAVSAIGPNDLIQQDAILNTLGNAIPVTTSTIVYHLPYHEPYDDHGGRSTYGIQNATQVNTNTGLRQGEVIPNSDTPLNLIGTPTTSTPAGIYQGAGYNINNSPLYVYQGPITNVALQPTSALQISTAGIQFIESYENGSYSTIVVGQPPVSQIGYGHNLTASELSSNSINIGGSSVSLAQPLNQQQIGQLFTQDINDVQNWMRPVANVAVTQTQYDMLCSLAFNIGQQNFTNSEAIKQLVAGNLQQVPNLWMQHTLNGSGTIVPELTVRRRSEVTKFMLAPFTETTTEANTTVSTGSTSIPPNQ